MPVTVNGEVVEDDLIQNEMKAMRPQLMKAMPDEPRSVIDQRAKDWARDNVVDQVLLRQAVSQDPEIVVRLTEKIAPPKQKEITEYYRKNRASLYRPESVKAVHVVSVIGETADEAAALGRIQEAERKIAEGAAFESLEGYEDLGLFPRGRMVPEFDAVVFAMRPGDTSPVFRTRFGFHIVRVLGRREDGIPELNDIQQEIRILLMRQKQRRAVDRYIDQLRVKADIRVE